MKKAIVWMCVLFLSGSTGCGSAANSKGEPKQNTDSAAVDLKILDYDGIQALIKSHKGKVVVMDCWATSCEPCKEEFPGLVAIHKKYGDQVACISLSFDFQGGEGVKPEDKKDEVLKFLREQKATFDNVLTNFPADDLYGKLQFASIPGVFVYGREGKLVKMFDNSDPKADNFTYKKDVEPKVAELLNK
jgi:thiol-disulfide isomerase/thioredoxin